MVGIQDLVTTVSNFDATQLQTMNDFIVGLNTDQLSFMATKLVELGEAHPVGRMVGFDYDGVMTNLTTISSGASTIQQFFRQLFDYFLPWVQGFSLGLFGFKASACVLKTILGRFEEAIVDFKWAGMGMLMLALLPKVIEMVEQMIFNS